MSRFRRRCRPPLAIPLRRDFWFPFFSVSVLVECHGGLRANGGSTEAATTVANGKWRPDSRYSAHNKVPIKLIARMSFQRGASPRPARTARTMINAGNGGSIPLHLPSSSSPGEIVLALYAPVLGGISRTENERGSTEGEKKLERETRMKGSR